MIYTVWKARHCQRRGLCTTGGIITKVVLSHDGLIDVGSGFSFRFSGSGCKRQTRWVPPQQRQLKCQKAGWQLLRPRGHRHSDGVNLIYKWWNANAVPHVTAATHMTTHANTTQAVRNFGLTSQRLMHFAYRCSQPLSVWLRPDCILRLTTRLNPFTRAVGVQILSCFQTFMLPQHKSQKPFHPCKWMGHGQDGFWHLFFYYFWFQFVIWGYKKRVKHQNWKLRLIRLDLATPVAPPPPPPRLQTQTRWHRLYPGYFGHISR